MRIRLKELLIDDPGSTYGSHTYLDWQSDIENYVDEVYQGEEHFASTYTIVVMHEGKLWGFEDWRNSEGENGISEEYTANPNFEVELAPVQEKQTITYEYLLDE
jgi:hypothetical protein